MLARVLLMLGLLVPAGCNTIVPNDGPLLTKVMSEKERDDAFVYALVTLDAPSVKVLRRHDYYPLSSKFGLAKYRQGVRVGPGDTLTITIFEAGPDGIFSTQERKSVAINLTVPESGRISVPFGGSVRASGRTPAQIRASLLASLRGRAVEPDVIVEVAQLRSRTAAVNGAVRTGALVPLILGNERILDVVAQAGGPSQEPYNTYVSVSRGGHTRTALLKTLIDHPRENIFVHPGDSLFLTHDPRQFTALGAVSKEGRYPFGSRELSLVEATALAGGFEDTRSNPQAVFVFRHEYEHVLRHLCRLGYIPEEQFYRIVNDHSLRDEHGRLPMVYRVDLSDADNFFIAKRFPVRAQDTLYVARKGAVDFGKIIQVVSQAGIALTLANQASNLGN